jgi:hypothetical protein
MRSMTVVDDVILHEEDGEAFLLHVASGRYFGLNRAGLVVWHALVAGEDPLPQLTAAWPQRSAETLRADADALVRQLIDAGLVRGAVGDVAT